MVELEVSVVFDEKKLLKPRAISFQVMDFQHDIICWMVLHYLWKGNSQNKDKVFHDMMNFESGFNILGNKSFFHESQ